MNVSLMTNNTLEQYIDQLDHTMDVNVKTRRSITRMQMALNDLLDAGATVDGLGNELYTQLSAEWDHLHHEWDVAYAEFKAATAERVDRQLAGSYQLTP